MTFTVSSDLTFITNENDRNLAERFRVLLGSNTRAFDCLAVSRAAIIQAREALVGANEAFWKIYGAEFGVMFRVRSQPKAPDIWKAAVEQRLLPDEIATRLNPFRPYLFGSVKITEFEALKFAAAASLLEELASSVPGTL